jgi:hypothetical protein
MPDHSSQLLSLLRQFSGQIQMSMWEVGGDGVKSEVDVFHEADTDTYSSYRLIFGAGDKYW